MKNMTLVNIAEAVQGTLCGFHDSFKDEVTGVVLDSRKVEEGFLFIATKGERVDGHDFIDAVFEKGARGVICEVAPENPKGPYILVEDSFAALKKLAAFYRNQLAIKVVGITGSVGKTSTKECVAAVLAQKYNVLKTEGNFNNEVGLPLTVLKIRDEHEIAVLEMGISDFGEMHRLSSIAQPDICVMTNIGQCHLENLKTRDGILKAKSEIFDFIQPDGSVCVNGDDDKLSTITEIKGIRPVFFGRDEKNQIYAYDIVNKGLNGTSMTIFRKNILEDGNEKAGNKAALGEAFQVEIPLPGEHMVYNALAATAVATTLGMTKEEITAGIASVCPVGGRSHIINDETYTLIDDCYNANPVSMKAAIDLLSMAVTRKAAVLGDMFELGTNEASLHEGVGVYAAQKNIDCIICIGNLAKNIIDGANQNLQPGTEVHYFENKDAFFKEYAQILKKKDTVLVKASHGMHFEEIVAKLQGK